MKALLDFFSIEMSGRSVSNGLKILVEFVYLLVLLLIHKKIITNEDVASLINSVKKSL